MKVSTALAVVLPSLVIASWVSDGGPASQSRADRGIPHEETRTAASVSASIGALVAAHNDYLSQMRNSGGPLPPSSVNCN